MMTNRMDGIALKVARSARATRGGLRGALAALVMLFVTFAAQAQRAEPVDAAQRSYLSANGLLNRGMNELAAVEYRKFIEEHPNHEKVPVARYGLGVALYRVKDFAAAAAALEPLLAQDQFEFAAEALFLLGQSRLELKQYEPAATPLEKLLKNHAEHELADAGAALLAEALYRAEKYDDVKSPWQTLTKSWPESPQRERVELLHGLSLVARKQDADAAKHFAQMQERFGAEGEFATRITLLLAQCLHRTEKLDEAAKQYETLVKADDAGEYLADALLGLGTLRQAQNDSKSAAELFDRLLEKFPQHPLAGQVMIERGRLWLDADQPDLAAAMFQQAANVDGSRRDESAYWLAKTEMRQEHFEQAATGLKDALERYPESPLRPEMLYDRGIALMKSGHPDEAREALANYRQDFAKHALAADALYLQAMIDHEQRRFDASLELCRAFQKQYPEHELAADIAFLAAENEFLSDRMPKAIERYESFIAAHPEDAQAPMAQYRLGSALYREQDLEAARERLEGVASGRRTPEPFRRALLMLGDISFRQEKYEAAKAQLEEYLSFGMEQPSADDALLKLALCNLRLEKPDDALTQLAQLIDTFADSPHRVQAFFERGQVLLTRDDLEGAQAAFAQAMALGPDSRFKPYTLNHLATIAMRREQFDEAAGLFADAAKAAEGDSIEAEATFQWGQALMAAKQYAKARDVFETVLNKHESSERAPMARAQRAIALARAGEEAEALAAIELVQKKDANKLQPALLAAVAYEKAWCLRELGRTDEAAAAYRDLLDAHANDPMAAHAMLELGELEAAAERYAPASEVLAKLMQAAAAKSPEVPADVRERGLYRLAVCEFELGRHESAAAKAQELIRDFPESALLVSAHQFAGEALYKLERHPQAADHFALIVEKFPADPAWPASLLRLGECQAHAGRWPESEKTFRTYLDRFPESELWFQAQFGLAWAKENRGLHDEAMPLYRKVIEAHNGPTAARAQFQIGECLFAKKSYDEAVRELLKVDILYGYPEWSAAALYEAGRCFEELSKPDQARAQFKLVQEKYPETQWAKLAAERLAAADGNRPASGG